MLGVNADKCLTSLRHFSYHNITLYRFSPGDVSPLLSLVSEVSGRSLDSPASVLVDCSVDSIVFVVSLGSKISLPSLTSVPSFPPCPRLSSRRYRCWSQ